MSVSALNKIYILVAMLESRGHHSFTPSLFHSLTSPMHSLILSLPLLRSHSLFYALTHSYTRSLTHVFTHSFAHSLFHSLTFMCPTDCHLLDHTIECNHSQTVTNKIFVAPYIKMIANTVIAMNVPCWIGAPTVCNLLPTESFAGIGVLGTGLRLA